MSKNKITKAVIPVAGMGTRFLPASKAVPKELLPLVDRPIIQYIVEEAISAGITSIIFVTACTKVSVRDHFDLEDLSSYKIRKANKDAALESIVKLNEKADFIEIRQNSPKGLGHAVLSAEAVINKNESFAVLLGDDVLHTSHHPSAIHQCIHRVEEIASPCSAIGVLEVPREDSSKYGMVAMDENEKITGLIEKPEPHESPSNWAIPGRYVFQSEIFDFIKKTAPGKGNEIQLTDAMNTMLKEYPYHAVKMQGERFDTGDKLGYIQANVQFALMEPQLKDRLQTWLKEII